ncbi:MAG: hypothetical protein A4E58_02249 [Syntrophorhabdus sp. PtaB.Bin006]|nr:MAG: hypothetical protein A4E58_02249 [Syntrophorhabdus sp. PtaB.Bin006]
MLSYLRQVAICESVRETIKQALVQSDDVGIRQKAHTIPTYDSILRAVSLDPSINDEETLKTFIVKHIMGNLRLTAIQKEHLNLNG